MEKYLIIIILVVLAYYVHRYCIQIEIEKILKTKEGFAATSGSDADVANSINTLAQIAKDLQAGGITVPGNLNIKAAINTTGDINTESAINAKGAINASGAINAKGGINSTSGVVNIDGDINAGGNINLKKRLFIGEKNMEWGSIISIKGGQKEGGYFDFLNENGDRQCYLMGKPDGAMFSNNLTVNGNIIKNDMYRKYDVAGYIQLAICSSYIPIYYGYNLIYLTDKDIQGFIRVNPSFPKKYIRNAGSLPGGVGGAEPFFVKNLCVFPGYKVKLYYSCFISDSQIFEEGEHESITQLRVQGAYVVFNTEPNPPIKMNFC